MKVIRVLACLAIGTFSALCIGCGGGGSGTPPSYGSSNASSPYYHIQTLTTKPGEAWGGVTISGFADSNSLGQACDPTTDANCIPEVGSGFPYAVTQNGIPAFTTNSNGQANFFTDAEPAIWYFHANGPLVTDCSSTTGSNQTYQDAPTGTTVPIECGSNLASMIAYPGSCTTTNNEVITRSLATAPRR